MVDKKPNTSHEPLGIYDGGNGGRPPIGIAGQGGSEDDPRRMLSVPEVAAFCGVSVKTIRRAIGRGDLIARRAGNSIRVFPDDLDAWLKPTGRSERLDSVDDVRRRRRGPSPGQPGGLRELLDD